MPHPALRQASHDAEPDEAAGEKGEGTRLRDLAGRRVEQRGRVGHPPGIGKDAVDVAGRGLRIDDRAVGQLKLAVPAAVVAEQPISSFCNPMKNL